MKRDSSKKTTITKASATGNDESKFRLRLLLHAVDGCVPYLTPLLMAKHFPPPDKNDNDNNNNNNNSSYLSIGLAVRDSSVAPTKDEDDDKIRGYTFQSKSPDPWMVPYHCVTVPSFDLLHDNSIFNKNKGQKVVPSSNSQVLVWTAHGRQALTPKNYFEAAALGLKSSCTVTLYDQSDIPQKPKRHVKAVERTSLWVSDYLSRCHYYEKQRNKNKTKDNDKNKGEKTGEKSLLDSDVWAPVVIPPTKDTPLSLDHVIENKGKISGIALVGAWSNEISDQISQFITDNPSTEISNICVLSTRSLSELLSIVSHHEKLITMIGTNLPTTCAKQKQAFVIDLHVEKSFKRVKSDNDNDATTILTKLDKNGCMDLHDKSLSRDVSVPLLQDCTCYACKDVQFSRAYIHHLVLAKELAAEIILFIHNLHHLLRLYETISTTDNVTELCDYIRQQLQTQETV